MWHRILATFSTAPTEPNYKHKSVQLRSPYFVCKNKFMKIFTKMLEPTWYENKSWAKLTRGCVSHCHKWHTHVFNAVPNSCGNVPSRNGGRRGFVSHAHYQGACCPFPMEQHVHTLSKRAHHAFGASTTGSSSHQLCWVVI